MTAASALYAQAWLAAAGGAGQASDMAQRVTMQPLVPDALVILLDQIFALLAGYQHDERAVFYR